MLRALVFSNDCDARSRSQVVKDTVCLASLPIVTTASPLPMDHCGAAVSTEAVLRVSYQPLAVFRVRPVTRCTSTMPGHTEAVLHVSYSPDGSMLASGGGDMTVRSGWWVFSCVGMGCAEINVVFIAAVMSTGPWIDRRLFCLCS